jgi:hypothetical protein
LKPEYFGLIEMTFSFGVILAIAIWQLYSVRRAIRIAREEDEAKARAAVAESELAPRHPER